LMLRLAACTCRVEAMRFTPIIDSLSRILYPQSQALLMR
jgi:hypothetical protein